MIVRAAHILCEDVRAEERKKFALLGVFTGEAIVMGTTVGKLPDGVYGRLASVCIVSTLFTPPGSYAVKTTLVAPDGNTVNEATHDMTMLQESSFTIITKIAPFEVRALGEYVMHYSIGGTEVTFPFKIKLGANAEVPAA